MVFNTFSLFLQIGVIYMKKIDYATGTMATSYMLASPLDACAKRIKRIQDKALDEVYDRLKDGQRTTGPVHAELDWEDSMKARGIRAAVEEFKKRHPRYANELEAMIQRQRNVRRNYVTFDIDEPPVELPDVFYKTILEEIGIPKGKIDRTFDSIMKLSNYLGGLTMPAKLLVK